MNKSEALERVAALEKETKELRKIIEAPEGMKSTDCTTTEDICRFLGQKVIVQKENEDDEDFAFRELKLWIKALRKGQGENGKDWVPNYKDKNQKRWFPIFNTFPWLLFLVCEFRVRLFVVEYACRRSPLFAN